MAAVSHGAASDFNSGLDAVGDAIESWSKEKGWWGPEFHRPLEMLMLITTELSECAEAFRNHNPKCEKAGMESFSQAEEEIADAVIRIIHFARERNFQLGEAILAKMKFNETRSVRHGGKAY